jgi:bacteriocin-like protein
MKAELLKGLTEDQIAKVKACDNASDLLQLAKDEGVELNDEQLAAVSGGVCSSSADDKKGKRKYES